MSNEITKLTKEVRDFCRSIGFDLIGIVKPDILKDSMQILHKRSKFGLVTKFENQNLNLRVSPELLLDNVKSILVLGKGYYVNSVKDNSNRDKKIVSGKVARYTRSRDYHKVMKEKMLEVITFLRSRISEFDYKILVDSSPLLERILALKTGQGFVGQNCCFYTKETGSFIFLGEILLTIDLQPELPVSVNKCHNCNLCINNCPTGALIGNSMLDPRKCLAYISQLKGILPKEIRNKMGSNLVGCDICQDVCPINQGLQDKNNNIFKPLAHLEEIDLIELLKMSKTQFKRKYGDAAFSWCGKNVIMRNAMIVLGNQKAKEGISTIIPFLKSEDHVLRAHAVAALAEIGAVLDGINPFG
jgi:epoxyqueuosine reductase